MKIWIKWSPVKYEGVDQGMQSQIWESRSNEAELNPQIQIRWDSIESKDLDQMRQSQIQGSRLSETELHLKF